jgi:O-antigen/teichoic acid export membrane protein
MVHKTMAVSSYIMWPMLIGLACVARPMIEILLTDRWIGCVIFLQINSIASILGPLSSANGQMINAVGRSDVSLKLDILKKTIGLCLLFITMPMGIIPFAIGRAVGILIAAILDTSVSKKLIGYGTFEQIHDLLPEIICSSVMALIVIFIGQFQMNNGVLLILQVITGVLSYVIISFLIKPIGFTYFKDIVIKMLKK